MKQNTFGRVALLDFEPSRDSFRQEVLCGLRKTPKELPCKFFYNKEGSLLFEQICELDEYYLTRTELDILERDGSQIAAQISSGPLLVELGSGASRKTRILLRHLGDVAAYMPIDISRKQLLGACQSLADAFPTLAIWAVCADYHEVTRLPNISENAAAPLIFFPGSTIGNFHPPEAIQFLRQWRRAAGTPGAMLVGVDLVKEGSVLERAYNDGQAITAAFNLNILQRANSELGANFDLNAFSHYAFYNEGKQRIEMHLISAAAQTVRMESAEIHFQKGEPIVTEYCYKHTIEGFAALAAEAGWVGVRFWTDPQQRFAVFYLVC